MSWYILPSNIQKMSNSHKVVIYKNIYKIISVTFYINFLLDETEIYKWLGKVYIPVFKLQKIIDVHSMMKIP
jgi:hypothetical protein